MSIYYMGSVEMFPEEHQAELNDFIQKGIPIVTKERIKKFHTTVLGTEQENHAHLTVINLLQGSNLEEVYMQSNRQSQKIKNLFVNPYVEIAITNDFGSVILECEGTVLSDEQTKQEKWEDWMAEFHPQGPSSEDYVIMRFVPYNLRVMI